MTDNKEKNNLYVVQTSDIDFYKLSKDSEIEKVIVNKINNSSNYKEIKKMVNLLIFIRKSKYKKPISSSEIIKLLFDYFITIGLIASGIYFTFIKTSQFGVTLLILGLGKAGIDTSILKKIKGETKE